VIQYLVNDRLIFNTGQYLYLATTVGADFDRAAFGSILKTRLSRCAQFIALRLSAGDFSSGSDGLPLLPGVISDRNRLLAAKTPWNRVRFIRGFGTSAASLARKSIGSNITCVVPSR
jgi:hypothetical protein